MKSWTLMITISLIAFIAGCSDSTGGDDPAGEITLIYVTFAGHIEDGAYYAECSLYPQYRDKLLVFADFIDSCGIPFNLQIDYELLVGASRCETPGMMAETGSTNVIDYIAKSYDFRIDPHKGGGFEEGDDNYADVRYIGGQVTGEITENAGGIVWDDEEQFDRFDGGEPGWQYPGFVWYPEILTVGVHNHHHLGDFSLDDMTSGVWKPADFGGDFRTHDADNRMIYVGPGAQHTDWWDDDDFPFESGADYVEVLARYIEQGRAPSGKIYTVTIAVPQKIILYDSTYYKIENQLDQLAPLVAEGKVIYAHYREVVDIWEAEYGAEPNIYTFDNIDSTDYTVGGD